VLFGTQAEAAGMIAFLASDDDSGFITAAALRATAVSPKRRVSRINSGVPEIIKASPN
jgi:NAD(P)-dependent dehydrogenase (short-subunit alcohol dehydrogenase family)